MRRWTLVACLLLASCGEPQGPPNVLFVVWDTVRADHLSLYGYPLKTTPALEQRSSTARVYDCTAVSCWTVPSHASMFTGLFPSEHGVNTERSVLGSEAETIAEVLQSNGYQTYLFSANPFVSVHHGLSQGFDVEEHPYDPELVAQAKAAIRRKLDPRYKSPIGKKIRGDQVRTWALKATGELATSRFFEFLDHRAPDRPFFAVLNYMEAHRARIPARETRERLFPSDRVERSYLDSPSEKQVQSATLMPGVELTEAQHDANRDVYDATILELDGELDRLFRRLEETALLENTVVILTSDHGEHLGDHRSYLHQYSLYDGLVRVPLVIWAAGRVEPGRERIPVLNLDLFATILELTGLSSAAPEARRDAVSVLDPIEDRALVSEYLVPYQPYIQRFRKADPDWDPSPFDRQLRTLRVGPYKLHVGPHGPFGLFDLSADPAEQLSLAEERPELAREMLEQLGRWVQDGRRAPAAAEERVLDPEEVERLKSLGYL